MLSMTPTSVPLPKVIKPLHRSVTPSNEEKTTTKPQTNGATESSGERTEDAAPVEDVGLAPPAFAVPVTLGWPDPAVAVPVLSAPES